MGNSSGKEQHGPAGTTVDQTPPISPTSPPTYVSPISPLNSHPPLSPTSSDLDPSRDRTPSLTLSSPEGCPSQNGVGNENGVVHVSPIKDTPVSFFKRSSTSALPAQVEPPTNCQGCDEVEAGLLQECMASLGLSTMDERSYTPADLLRCFLNETEQMKEDLRSLKDKIESERNDWLQFQTDLQVALVVADRLRTEAEEELGTLREVRQDLERQLADAKQVQEEDGRREWRKTEIKEGGLRSSQNKGTPRQQGATERLSGEKEKGKELNGEKEPGTAVKPSDTINVLVNGTSQTSVTQTLKSVSKSNPSREKLSSEDSLISSYKDKKGDKPSFISSGSALIDPPIKSKLKPQEDFSTLLRRHGGSKRNSMLRWCQNRTSGYQNIEITNFSSSWMDGLAFCAVYHSYLPSSIPFHTLRPENKRENLLLAFQTGESVGITATLTAEEMLRSEGPDWQRVLGYVENIYQHFEM